MNVHRARAPWLELPELAAPVELLLASGGDERINLDPATRRNRYGTTVAPSPAEIFLSSSTASTITPRAYRAVESEWAALTAGRQPVDAWFESLRSRLLDLFGVAGSAAVLTGSGTEAELVALAIARNILGGGLTNIVIAPTETGSGVLRAAAGAHFLDSTPFGEIRRAGTRLDGWEDADIETAIVEIRDSQGNLRETADVDADARGRATAALAAGRSVLLHRLETSKTGRSGLTEAAASQILAGAPDRVAVIVDCCQLRCSRERVRQFLERGFLVAITGSKFFGGPAFSGALLLPPQIVERITHLTLPAGLADYGSRLDWPDGLRAKVQLRWANEANLGLGLRWVAALEEMERFFALPADIRSAALAAFESAVRKRAQSFQSLCEISGGSNSLREGPDSILPFAMTHRDGAPFSFAETAAIHARLRLPCARLSAGDSVLPQIFHLGQPVAVGPKTALRICASAPMISEIAERVLEGESLTAAFAPWGRNLDALFEKWRRLMDEISAQRHASIPGEPESAHERQSRP
jgi:hypothetical protein